MNGDAETVADYFCLLAYRVHKFPFRVFGGFDYHAVRSTGHFAQLAPLHDLHLPIVFRERMHRDASQHALNRPLVFSLVALEDAQRDKAVLLDARNARVIPRKCMRVELNQQKNGVLAWISARP
jgi:hypothetical protein